MKIIKYKFCATGNTKTTDEAKKAFNEKIIICSEDNLESNIKIAEEESYNGEYTVEDEVEEQWQ